MKEKTSKLRITILAILGLLILSLIVFWNQMAKRTISVAMSGAPGLAVSGHWTVDGVRRDFEATLPTNFVTRARSLSFELIRQGEPGVFKVQIKRGRTNLGLMSSESEYGIRGHIGFNGNAEERLLASFGQ